MHDLKQLIYFSKELRKRAEDIRMESYALLGLVENQLAKKHGLEEGQIVLVLGGHECDSDTGYCYYDDDSDPAHDECLVCGGPRERK